MGKLRNLINKSVKQTEISKVLEERGNRYGDFATHARITMKLKIQIENHLKEFNPNSKIALDQMEALHMICHKIGRIVNGDPNYIDSWIDIAGYAQLVVNQLNKKS